MNKIKMACTLAGLVLAGCIWTSANAEPKQPKWLVLDKITYQSGVDRVAFEGIDQLLLTKLVQAKKYKCLDRDAYRTAAREEGFGAKVELVPAGYSMRGEIVQMQRTGKTRQIGGSPRAEYVATISLRANDLKTQQPYEAETLRVTGWCQTPKDMLVYATKRIALAILMRDYPPYIMDYDEDDMTLTLSYGGDFMNVGEQYEVRRRKAIVDDDTGDTVYKEKTVGVCEVTDVGKNTSSARLISGKAKVKHVLRFYDNAEPFAVPPATPVATTAPASDAGEIKACPLPPKKQRIAIAPFISKRTSVNVRGLQLGARTWMDDVGSHLNTCLTKTESFKVLDRSFGPEIDRELNRIANDPNADPNDMCRLSHKLATDYLVVAEVVFSDVVSPGTDFATGLPLPPPSCIFAEVRFRCVVAPTTQIAWADTLKIDSKYFGGTAETFSSTSAEYCAGMITQMIQARLAPADFKRAQEQAAAAAAAAATAPATQTQPAHAAAQPSQGIDVGF